jgi:ribulose-bisphosphate carboxylase large chain
MSWIDVTYHVRARAADIESAAAALALEQSVEVPADIVRDPWVREHVMGRVSGIEPLDAERFRVGVRLATLTTGHDAAQALNMLFGNSSLHEHVELVDAELPPDFVAAFSGPRHGIDGIRRLAGVHGRPLTCAALKPQGLPLERLAELAFTFAAAGIDVVKDDHGLADQPYSPFAARVAACRRALERAGRETGRPCLYAPSLVGAPRALEKQARIARDEGAQMVLVAPALVGLPAFHELVSDGLDVPVLAHPAYAGAARVAPPFLLGTLFRMLGADAVIFPNAGGRFAYSSQTCAAIADRSRRPWPGMRAMLPVPAGGMSVERAPEIVRAYGNDTMLLIGGSLLAAGDRLGERTRAFVDAVAGASALRSGRPAAAAPAA